MEINKQLFEDVLSGKLKGRFVLRNGQKINSNDLRKSDWGEFCYRFTNTRYVFTCNGYTDPGYQYAEDVIDFIPDTNMKENELTIEIPDGKIVDWEESAKQEKIILKRKDIKPRSWKEYLELNTGFDGAGIDWNCGGVQTTGLHHRGKAIVPTNLAAPFIAMMQLMSIRQVWIGDWTWVNGNGIQWNICYVPCIDHIELESSCIINFPLSFPTKEMAEDFMNCFKDLLEIAKTLI
jgi:hypothetical protein